MRKSSQSKILYDEVGSRRIFIAGWFLGMGSFVAANLYSYHIAEPPCCDFSIPFGVPFPLAQTGGFTGGTRFIVLGVIADVIVGLVMSVAFAWVFAKSVPWIVSRFGRAVQWHVKTRS
jgi:hypothetical protein